MSDVTEGLDAYPKSSATYEAAIERLTAELAAMTQERDDWKSMYSDVCEVSTGFSNALDATTEELKFLRPMKPVFIEQQTKLAASQAYAQQLWDALLPLAECHLPPEGFEYKGCTAHFTTAIGLKAREAIALPSADSALKQCGAKLLRDAIAKHANYRGDIHQSALEAMAAELEKS